MITNDLLIANVNDGTLKRVFPRAPIKVEGAIVFLNYGSIIVCGGRNENLDIISHCSSLNLTASNHAGYLIWEKETSMTWPRTYSSGAFLGPTLDMFWVTGGETIIGAFVDLTTTTEIYDLKSGTWSPGIDLDDQLAGHCTVQVIVSAFSTKVDFKLLHCNFFG